MKGRNLSEARSLIRRFAPSGGSGPVGIGDVTGLTAALAAKQDALVSGTNIKTVNSTSLLGSGDVPVASGGSAAIAWVI